MKLAFSFWLVSIALLQAADEDQLALGHIRQTVALAVSRSDNYICAQDLARLYYLTYKPDLACHQPPQIPTIVPRLEDRLKLDVAVSQGSEIYSWHGEHKFSSADVSQLVREGPISTGSFNGYLRNIFVERGANFTFRGRSVINGLDLYEFDYNVPLDASDYELQARKGMVRTPFHGTFAALAGTFQLYSLTVIADASEISRRSDICEAQTNLTYQMVQIASHKSLLPASFDLLVGSRSGIVTDSKGKYSGCREYTGESTLHFDFDAKAENTTTPPELQSAPLKPGIYLPIALRGVIDEDSAYAGLPVEASLTHKVKIEKNLVLERGAILHGTLTRFQIFHQPSHLVAIQIEFNSISDGNRIYLCNATHEVDQTFLPTLGGGGGRRRMPMPTSVQAGNGQDDDGALLFSDRHVHLDNSFTSVFMTASEPRP